MRLGILSEKEEKEIIERSLDTLRSLQERIEIALKKLEETEDTE